jgi:hypothetical protein
MKWVIPGFAAIALAIFSVSIPAPIFSSEASASRMDGKGNCAGGVCTGKKSPFDAPKGKKSKRS